LVTFEGDDSDISVHDEEVEEKEKYFHDNEYPSKIYCFFQVMEHPKTHAVVHSCCNRDTDQDSCMLSWLNPLVNVPLLLKMILLLESMSKGEK